MTKEEYKKKLDELNSEFKQKKFALYKEFALSNNPYRVGDILQDHFHIIKVEKIKIDVVLSTPECVYYGTQLTQKLEPKKKQDEAPMWQSNVERKLN